MILKEISLFIRNNKKATLSDIMNELKIDSVEIKPVLEILQNMGKIKVSDINHSCGSIKGCSGCLSNCTPTFVAIEYEWTGVNKVVLAPCIF